MRSRFTAYKLSGYGQYLFDTWVKPEEHGLSPALLDQSDVQWQRLEVEGSAMSGDAGWVRFKAYFDEDGIEKVMHEHSLFVRSNKRWLYQAGMQL